MSLNIAIVGAGAIGGYLGVKLALSGCNVTFIARGENLKAIQANGMTLTMEDGTSLHAPQVKACTIDQATPHDYVFLTMKSHQVSPVAAEIGRLCHDNTAVVHAKRCALVVLLQPGGRVSRPPTQLHRSWRHAVAAHRPTARDWRGGLPRC